MASSISWPPATVWRSAFGQHYSSSSFSKWHRLYVDTSCVLLGLKTALLVDYVSPNAKKLQLYLKDVARSMHDISSSNNGSTVKCDSAAECQFCKCMSDCCILTVEEDTLIVNTRYLTQDWGSDHDHGDSKLMGRTLKPTQSRSMGSHASLGGAPVYVDVTKGLQQPKLIEDEKKAILNGIFIQWLGTVQSSFRQKTDSKIELCIVPCHSKVSHSSAHLDQTLRSVQQQTVEEDNTSNFNPTCGDDIELNVCTLFGWLLGYPVVYWFDIQRGYSLDMVELVCFTVYVCKADSETSSLNIKQVAT